MAAAGMDGIFRLGMYEGCLSGSDVGRERRPYHKNCNCALHDKEKKKKNSNNIGQPPQHCSMCKSVSYPLRRAGSEGSLSLMARSSSSSSLHSTPSSSPAAVMPAAAPRHRRMASFDVVDENEEDIVFFKI